MVVSKYHEPEVYMNIYEVRLKFKRNPMQIYFPGIVFLVFINTTPLPEVINIH
jgi:hypothetical protein